MHLGIAEGSGEVRIHLHQHQRAVPDQVHFIDRTDGKGHIAMLVHGGNRTDHHRSPVLILTSLQGLAENGGGALRNRAHGPLLPIGLAQCPRHEPGIVVQNSLQLLVMEAGIVPQGQTGVEMAALHSGFLQVLQVGHDLNGLSSCLCRKDIVPVLDQVQRLICAHKLALIKFLICFHALSFPYRRRTCSSIV